jgi:hypothetical protein
MNDTAIPSQSEEWVKTLCGVIQKELASVNDRSLCSADKEEELYRRFVNPESNQSQVSRAKSEIYYAVSSRRRELVMLDVAQMMHGWFDELFIPTENVREVSIDTAVDMAMTGFICDQKDGRILHCNAGQELKEVDKLNERLDTLVPFVDHAQERSELQAKIDALKAELLGVGVMVKERTALFSILADFIDEFSAVGRDWSPVLEEHELLNPVARYIYDDSVHNSVTTKYLLVEMIEMISRPTLDYLNKCEKRSLLGPSSTLFVSGLCFFGVFHAKLEGVLSEALWVAWALFFGWSALRYFDYTRARMIRRRVNALIDNFKWTRQPITCDGREMAVALRKIQRLGLDVPSLVYSLMRLLVPGADGLYAKRRVGSRLRSE